MSSPSELEVATGGAIVLPGVSIVRKSPSRLFWERFRQDKAALGGGVAIILLITIAAVGGPIAQAVTGHSPNDIIPNSQDSFGVPFGPSSHLWFGADAEGRDLFVRTMYGARI
jgi:ABC-type dipeptide/oligopeptide/nickel transport system permease subunit